MKFHLKTIVTLAITYCYLGFAQQQKPKLVVGIVVDQMRYEYLYRFQDNYTEDGFKRILREGYNVKNTHYNYVPTTTCLGHASIYTGTTPTNHGIVSNSWYSRDLKRKKYCVEDSTVFLVNNSGLNKDEENKNFSRSPKNIKTTTITDELKLFTNERSKVIGLSIKDRSAISPAGHLADAAYWYNSGTGHFVTSSYYKERLPEWLIAFNTKNKADSLLNLVWKPLLPIEKYTNSNVDDDVFEKVFKGRKKSTFPYNLKKLRSKNRNYAMLPETPYGNTILTELIQATIKGEQLGKGKETDFLSVSYSSTDYVGHGFGIRSKEIEDTYVRMDREIATVLKTLDEEIGKNNYVLFLTADHAASDHPVFLETKQLPGKFFNTKQLKKQLNAYLVEVFGENQYVAYLDNTQIYFSNTNISKEEVINKSAVFLKTVAGIKQVFAPCILTWPLSNSTMGTFIKNSFNLEESGDIIYHTYSGWMDKRSNGTTHGTAYTSDTHVPLVWYGSGIPQGETVKEYQITQIAPTLSMLLNIPLANASDKTVIMELFSN
ncbi:alkaline phosphatase family protein [Arenibacter sp. M-2]|uniref:alkaline phosphatase PafA n=1 Tax=Arenibacter sp. M-2 TaxID=3053612 RepID=UPI0025701C04|nr:alkaline phosphatase PafA [Arenibacter sp. M-2]MDL5514936.1 alkaline phosphatase family protein [Arenibacter sp. M-2]